MGLIQRVVEAAGIATISVSSARDITEAVNPPRACYLDYPLGHQGGGRPSDRDAQLTVIRRVLRAAQEMQDPGVIDLPFRWE